MEIDASEKEIQKAIIERLEWMKDVYFIRNNSFAGNFTRSNGTKGWVKNNKKGSPDIIVCKKGKWFGFEIKCKKGKQSPDQKQAEEDIKRAGGEYYILKSVDDLLNNESFKK